jgi:hypothetical protein
MLKSVHPGDIIPDRHVRIVGGITPESADMEI